MFILYAMQLVKTNKIGLFEGDYRIVVCMHMFLSLDVSFRYVTGETGKLQLIRIKLLVLFHA